MPFHSTELLFIIIIAIGRWLDFFLYTILFSFSWQALVHYELKIRNKILKIRIQISTGLKQTELAIPSHQPQQLSSPRYLIKYWKYKLTELVCFWYWVQEAHSHEPKASNTPYGCLWCQTHYFVSDLTS